MVHLREPHRWRELLVVEVDGGQHADDGDTRTRWLEASGYRVICFWNNEVLAKTRRLLRMILDARRAAPHAASSSGGEGNRIWRQHVFSPLPSGRGGDPSPRRWEGKGELPPPVSVRRQHESGSSPSPSRARCPGRCRCRSEGGTNVNDSPQTILCGIVPAKIGTYNRHANTH